MRLKNLTKERSDGESERCQNYQLYTQQKWPCRNEIKISRQGLHSEKKSSVVASISLSRHGQHDSAQADPTNRDSFFPRLASSYAVSCGKTIQFDGSGQSATCVSTKSVTPRVAHPAADALCFLLSALSSGPVLSVVVYDRPSRLFSPAATMSDPTSIAQQFTREYMEVVLVPYRADMHRVLLPAVRLRP